MDATENDATQTLIKEVENLQNAIEENIKGGDRGNLRLLRDALSEKVDELDEVINTAESAADFDEDIASIADSAVNTIVTLKDVLMSLVNAGKAFTAYNVTLEARAKGIQGFHKTFRDLVHDAFAAGEMGNYERDQIVISVLCTTWCVIVQGHSGASSLFVFFFFQVVLVDILQPT